MKRFAGLALPVLFLLASFILLAPIFAHPQDFAWPYDWRYFASWIEVGRRSVLWWHQVPLWNPYGCGGEVLWANPQSEVAAPTFLLPLMFGTALGIKLVLVAYIFFAFDGMYRLARANQLSFEISLFAAVLFGTSGWLALHLSSGHSNFASAGLFPYLVLFYQRAQTQTRFVIPLGAIAAWIIALGGTSTPAMAVVLLFVLALYDAVATRSARPLVVLAGGATCAALVGAVRLLPALEFAVDHPRRKWETDANPIWQIIAAAYSWQGVSPVAGKRYWFHEYGFRLSLLTPPLILWSMTQKPLRKWWVVVLVALGIVAGAAIPYGPWWLLKQLPLYRDLRVPSRYALLLALSLPLLCAQALASLLDRFALSPARRRGIIVAVTVLAFAEGSAYDWKLFKNVFNFSAEVAGPSSDFYLVRGEWREMMPIVLSNRGVIACDEEAPLQRAAQLDLDRVSQARLSEPDAGQIGAIRLTPNLIEVEVDLTRATTLMVNQNWNEHWRVSPGKVVRVGPKWPQDRDGGRLGAELSAGKYVARFVYRPRSFVVGILLSGLSIPALMLLFFWWGKRQAVLFPGAKSTDE